MSQRRRDTGKTVVVVRHDSSTAEEYSDRAMILNIHRIAEDTVSLTTTAGRLKAADSGRLAGLDACDCSIVGIGAKSKRTKTNISD